MTWSTNVHRLIEGWTGVPVPVLACKGHTYQTVQQLNSLYGRIQARRPPAHRHRARRFRAAREHQRAARPGGRAAVHQGHAQDVRVRTARQGVPATAQRIVLPEGTEERILRAADIILRRGAAEVILLGNEQTIRNNASTYGVDISDAQIIDPVNSDLLDPFAEDYLELRKHKGVIAEMAWDRMADPTYFGTMMVHKGFADGMVSGSHQHHGSHHPPRLRVREDQAGQLHRVQRVPHVPQGPRTGLRRLRREPQPEFPAAGRNRPGFRRRPPRSSASKPRVAMLSYSTGASGKGEDVEKVIEATAIARRLAEERGLDIPIEGTDPVRRGRGPGKWAQVKMPDSKVAGQATVFIFPDLNTGNNTYKAVQRAANAVAIGPVLQGTQQAESTTCPAAALSPTLSTLSP